MDEYFCPNCGAILNDQYGFDPSCGSWTCTVCGKILMDEDVYDGDTYEGIAWFCDSCGALLNKQSGFSDSYGSWTCTECGFWNSITEDDIIDENVFCPNCGAMLNEQAGFNKYDNEWECTSCGVTLHHGYSDDEYTVVEKDQGPECPNCGALLREQFCFADYYDDWNCTECGARLQRDDCFSDYEIVESDDEEREDREDFDDSHEDNYEEYGEQDVGLKQEDYIEPPIETFVSEKEQIIYKRKLRRKRIKAFFFRRKKIQVGVECSDLLKKDIGEVQMALHNNAFNNIKTIPIKDIYIGSNYRPGEVEKITIDGTDFFRSQDMFSYDSDIVIMYHDKKEISIPFSARSQRKQNHIELCNRIRELGFTEVTEFPIRDLVFGWIKKNGSVERILIDGNDTFKENVTFKYDVKIVVEYHTFKK